MPEEFKKLEKTITERQIRLIEKMTEQIGNYIGLTKYQSWDEICRLIGDKKFFCFPDGTSCKLKQISKKKAATLINFLIEYRQAVKSGREDRIDAFWDNEGRLLMTCDKYGSFIYEGDF